MLESKRTTCPVCGGEMALEVNAYPMGSAFFKDERFCVDIYRCKQCSHVELFAAENDLVTCPKCGARHSSKEKCVACTLNSAFDGTYTN